MKILVGWKEMAVFAKRHVRTLRRWHYEKMKIPFLKSAPGKGGKLSIADEAFYDYMLKLHNLGIVSAAGGHEFPNVKKK